MLVGLLSLDLEFRVNFRSDFFHVILCDSRWVEQSEGMRDTQTRLFKQAIGAQPQLEDEFVVFAFPNLKLFVITAQLVEEEDSVDGECAAEQN